MAKNRPDGKLTSEGAPRTIRQLVHSVKNRPGSFKILSLTNDGSYIIGSDGEKVLTGPPSKRSKESFYNRN